jgi:hypothetical protein
MAFLNWADAELRRTAGWERVVFVVLWAWGLVGLPLGLWWQERVGIDDLLIVITLGALGMPTLLAVTLLVKFTGQRIASRVRRRP